METKLLSEIKKVLSTYPEYWENDTLLRSKVIEDIREYRADLIESLFRNEKIKDAYSLQIGDNFIFKTDEFMAMLRFKSYWENSYTKFSNEIGLTSQGKYLEYNSDVVLNFPHKDCILEGGMAKEDIDKNEVYYHTVLAREEIDVMLSPKVLTDIKKFDEQGEREITEIEKQDNLIIKGNNLIALHSLKERYTGKVKQIFIDPPYYFIDRKNDDTFGYNSNFKLSTWLTFMKNRLKVAQELLSEDGSLWITIDDGGSHYLKVLCDEVFGINNFIANIIWQKKYSPQNDANYFSDMHDHILVYAKSKKTWKPNQMPRTAAMDARYTNPDNDPRGPWKSSDFSVRTYSSEYDYEITTPGGRKVRPPNGRVWSTSKQNFEKLVKDNRIWFGVSGKNVPSLKKFLSEVKEGATPTTAWIMDDLYSEDGYDDFWGYEEVSHTQDSRRELIALGLEFSTPKPEKLLQRILSIGSNKSDIVLDFFMGSATTQAVAMKMKRQFIGIEQMDYIKTVSVPRLQKVIEGEQGGISKEVEWRGGGSFVYAELQELNMQYVHQIHGAKNEKDLRLVIKQLEESAYLNFKVDMEKVIAENTGFSELSLDEQKRLLIEVLDANQLYLNYSEIDDAKFDVPESVKTFNRSFYEVGEEK